MSEILVQFMGRFANQVIQYMTARSIQIESGISCTIKLSKSIDGVDIGPQVIDSTVTYIDKSIRVTSNTFNLTELSNLIAQNNISLVINSYCARASYFSKNIDIFRQEIKPIDTFGYDGFSEKYLVIHVRLGDIIMDTPHPWYKPLPLNYYSHLIDTTGLRPVFVGEFCDHFYSNALKMKFKDAIFIDSNNALIIFNILYKSANVALAISTFSWLATFLSPFTKKIFYPISGIFNPLAFRAGVDFQHNFINESDHRIIYYKFSDDIWGGTFSELSDLVFGDVLFEQFSNSNIISLLKIANENLPLNSINTDCIN